MEMIVNLDKTFEKSISGSYFSLSEFFIAILFFLGSVIISPAIAQSAPQSSPDPTTSQTPSAVLYQDPFTPEEDEKDGAINENGYRVLFFPQGDPFTPLLADPRQPTSNISYFLGSNNHYGQFDGTFGADIGIIRWESEVSGINKSIQVGVMGAAFSRFAFVQTATYLESTDFIIGLPITIRYNKFSTRIFFYHDSSHTGYSYTSLMNLNKNTDYGQELLQIIPSYDVTRYFRIYGGGAYRVVGLGFYPSAQDSLIGQAGFELYAPEWKKAYSRAYMALNIISQGINGYTPSEDLQIGILTHRPASWVQFRTAIDFYNGYSPMYDFPFLKENYVALGAYFDF